MAQWSRCHLPTELHARARLAPGAREPLSVVGWWSHCRGAVYLHALELLTIVGQRRCGATSSKATAAPQVL